MSDASQKAGNNSEIFSVIGELVMIANAIDHLSNRIVIAACSLSVSPMMEPVVALIDIRQKIELLKGRAKHIAQEDWRKGYVSFCSKAEAVYRQRNIVCHTAAALIDDEWVFQPTSAVKMLKSLDLERKSLKPFPLRDIREAIKTGETALGAGVNLLENLERLEAERLRRHGVADS